MSSPGQRRFDRGKTLIVAVVVVGIAIYLWPYVFSRGGGASIPDHWTHAYAEQTWDDFNRNGRAEGVFDKSCVLDAIETQWPDPRDAKRAFDHAGTNNPEYRTVVNQIGENCTSNG